MKATFFWLQIVALIFLCIMGNLCAQTIGTINIVNSPRFCPERDLQVAIPLNNGTSPIPASKLVYTHANFLIPDFPHTRISPTQVEIIVPAQSTATTLDVVLNFKINPCLTIGTGPQNDKVEWLWPTSNPSTFVLVANRTLNSYNKDVPVLEVRNNTASGSRDSYVGLIFNDPLASIIVRNNKPDECLGDNGLYIWYGYPTNESTEIAPIKEIRVFDALNPNPFPPFATVVEVLQAGTRLFWISDVALRAAFPDVTDPNECLTSKSLRIQPVFTTIACNANANNTSTQWFASWGCRPLQGGQPAPIPPLPSPIQLNPTGNPTGFCQTSSTAATTNVVVRASQSIPKVDVRTATPSNLRYQGNPYQTRAARYNCGTTPNPPDPTTTGRAFFRLLSTGSTVGEGVARDIKLVFIPGKDYVNLSNFTIFGGADNANTIGFRIPDSKIEVHSAPYTYTTYNTADNDLKASHALYVLDFSGITETEIWAMAQAERPLISKDDALIAWPIKKQSGDYNSVDGNFGELINDMPSGATIYVAIDYELYDSPPLFGICKVPAIDQSPGAIISMYADYRNHCGDGMGISSQNFGPTFGDAGTDYVKGDNDYVDMPNQYYGELRYPNGPIEYYPQSYGACPGVPPACKTLQPINLFGPWEARTGHITVSGDELPISGLHPYTFAWTRVINDMDLNYLNCFDPNNVNAPNDMLYVRVTIPNNPGLQLADPRYFPTTHPYFSPIFTARNPNVPGGQMPRAITNVMIANAPVPGLPPLAQPTVILIPVGRLRDFYNNTAGQKPPNEQLSFDLSGQITIGFYQTCSFESNPPANMTFEFIWVCNSNCYPGGEAILACGNFTTTVHCQGACNGVHTDEGATFERVTFGKEEPANLVTNPNITGNATTVFSGGTLGTNPPEPTTRRNDASNLPLPIPDPPLPITDAVYELDEIDVHISGGIGYEDKLAPLGENDFLSYIQNYKFFYFDISVANVKGHLLTLKNGTIEVGAKGSYDPETRSWAAGQPDITQQIIPMGVTPRSTVLVDPPPIVPYSQYYNTAANTQILQMHLNAANVAAINSNTTYQNNGFDIVFNGRLLVQQVANSVMEDGITIIQPRMQFATLAVSSAAPTPVKSCDSYASSISFMRPKTNPGLFTGASIPVNSCENRDYYIQARVFPAELSGDDFPEEFRNFIVMKNEVRVTFPKGFTMAQNPVFEVNGRWIFDIHPFEAGSPTINTYEEICSILGQKQVIFRAPEGGWPVTDVRDNSADGYSMSGIHFWLKPVCDQNSCNQTVSAADYIGTVSLQTPNQSNTGFVTDFAWYSHAYADDRIPPQANSPLKLINGNNFRVSSTINYTPPDISVNQATAVRNSAVVTVPVIIESRGTSAINDAYIVFNTPENVKITSIKVGAGTVQNTGIANELQLPFCSSKKQYGFKIAIPGTTTLGTPKSTTVQVTIEDRTCPDLNDPFATTRIPVQIYRICGRANTTDLYPIPDAVCGGVNSDCPLLSSPSDIVLTPTRSAFTQTLTPPTSAQDLCTDLVYQLVLSSDDQGDVNDIEVDLELPPGVTIVQNLPSTQVLNETKVVYPYNPTGSNPLPIRAIFYPTNDPNLFTLGFNLANNQPVSWIPQNPLNGSFQLAGRMLPGTLKRNGNVNYGNTEANRTLLLTIVLRADCGLSADKLQIKLTTRAKGGCKADELEGEDARGKEQAHTLNIIGIQPLPTADAIITQDIGTSPVSCADATRPVNLSATLPPGTPAGNYVVEWDIPNDLTTGLPANFGTAPAGALIISPVALPTGYTRYQWAWNGTSAFSLDGTITFPSPASYCQTGRTLNARILRRDQGTCSTQTPSPLCPERIMLVKEAAEATLALCVPTANFSITQSIIGHSYPIRPPITNPSPSVYDVYPCDEVLVEVVVNNSGTSPLQALDVWYNQPVPGGGSPLPGYNSTALVYVEVSSGNWQQIPQSPPTIPGVPHGPTKLISRNQPSDPPIGLNQQFVFRYKVIVPCSSATIGNVGQLLPQHTMFLYADGYSCNTAKRVVSNPYLLAITNPVTPTIQLGDKMVANMTCGQPYPSTVGLVYSSATPQPSEYIGQHQFLEWDFPNEFNLTPASFSPPQPIVVASGSPSVTRFQWTNFTGNSFPVDQLPPIINFTVIPSGPSNPDVNGCQDYVLTGRTYRVQTCTLACGPSVIPISEVYPTVRLCGGAAATWELDVTSPDLATTSYPPCEEVEVLMELTNTGSSTISNIGLTPQLSANLTLTEDLAYLDQSANWQPVATNPIPNLNGGASHQLKFKVKMGCSTASTENISFTGTGTGSCGQNVPLASTLTLQVEPPPAVNLQTAYRICSSTQQQVDLGLPATTKYVYELYNGATPVHNGSAPPPLLSDPGNYTLNVVSAFSGCSWCASSYSFSISNSALSASFMPNSICLSTPSAILNPTVSGCSGTCTYNWHLAGQIQSLGNLSTLTVSSRGEYVLDIEDGQGCSVSASVTVNPQPTADFTINQSPACANQSVSVSPVETGTQFNHLWTVTSGTFTTSSNLATPQFSLTQSGAYAIEHTVTTGNGACSQTVSRQVNVLSTAISVLPCIDPSGSLTFCQGGQVRLKASNSLSSPLLWEHRPPSSTTWTPVTGGTARNYNAKTSGYYRVTGNLSNGCTVSCESDLVTVISTDASFTIVPSPPRCEGTDVNFIPTITGPDYTHDWLVTNTATSIPFPVITDESPNEVYPPGKYTVKHTLTYKKGGLTCTSQVASQTLNIGSLSIVGLCFTTSNGTNIVCEGANLILNASTSFASNTLSWYKQDGSGWIQILVNADGTPITGRKLSITSNTRKVMPADAGTYRVVGVLTNGCPFECTEVVTVIAKPALTLAYDFCDNAPNLPHQMCIDVSPLIAGAEYTLLRNKATTISTLTPPATSHTICTDPSQFDLVKGNYILRAQLPGGCVFDYDINVLTQPLTAFGIIHTTQGLSPFTLKWDKNCTLRIGRSHSYPPGNLTALSSLPTGAHSQWSYRAPAGAGLYSPISGSTDKVLVSFKPDDLVTNPSINTLEIKLDYTDEFGCTMEEQTFILNRQVSTPKVDPLQPVLPDGIEVTVPEILIAPNPANQSFTLYYNLPDKQSESTMEVYDLTGKLLRTEELLRNQMQMSFTTQGLAAGLYLLKVKTNGVDQIEGIKLVIVK